MFVGNLQVTEPERMRQSVLDGIGRGKAYGCGLITLGSPGEIATHG
jgi:CRISPR system Cascade subunit CasE